MCLDVIHPHILPTKHFAAVRIAATLVFGAMPKQTLLFDSKEPL
jgi:hypothetical protein